MSQKTLNPLTADSDENSITETVIQAKKGDEQAFGQLYNLYFDKIYRFIYFRVNHKETAEDLAEDVFVKAWKRISDVSEDSFGGWLYSICKNTIIDYYRQKKIIVDLDEIAGTFESEQDVLAEVNLVLDQKNLALILKELSPEQQTLIRLKFIEDLSNTEISGIMGKSEGSIRVIQHRAILKLQDLHNQRFNKTNLQDEQI
jgi:RNA polymerase sigma-70 factor, ECF subfamily